MLRRCRRIIIIIIITQLLWNSAIFEFISSNYLHILFDFDLLLYFHLLMHLFIIIIRCKWNKSRSNDRFIMKGVVYVHVFGWKIPLHFSLSYSFLFLDLFTSELWEYSVECCLSSYCFLSDFCFIFVHWSELFFCFFFQKSCYSLSLKKK